MRNILKGLLIAGIVALNTGVCFAGIPFDSAKDFQGVFISDNNGFIGREIHVTWLAKRVDGQDALCIDGFFFTEAKRVETADGARLLLSNPKADFYNFTLERGILHGKEYFVYKRPNNEVIYSGYFRN